MPAAAVIFNPIAYIKVVAVKKLVVGPLPSDALRGCYGLSRKDAVVHSFVPRTSSVVYCGQIRVFKAGKRLHTLAWNNKIWPRRYFVGLRVSAMVNRSSRGYSYEQVRGEILGFWSDELLRKHLSRMFSLIKNES